MDKIVYKEFGVEIHVNKYHRIDNKLKGMRAGKPFVMESGIYINVGEDLCQVDEIGFYDLTGKTLQRENVQLDSNQRIAGIIHNQKQILLLKNSASAKEFYCFPGGHRRENETEMQCLEREMLEETGIDITSTKVTKLKELQQEGFGPETFFVIDLGNEKINFRNELEGPQKTVLVVVPIADLTEYENLYPRVIATEITNRLYSDKI